MTKIVRLAFGCQARVGKDASCFYLQQKYPRSKTISFAKPLYDIQHFAQERCGFKKDKDRRFLQWVGSEWARQQDPDVWTDIARNEIHQTPSDMSIFVSDVRFPNELRMLQEEGFKTVRIVRDTNHTLDKSQQLHTSETSLVDVSLQDWDYVVYNNGTLDDLRFKLDQLAKRVENI